MFVDNKVSNESLALLIFGVFLISFYKIYKEKRKYFEFNQEIIPLNITIEDIKNGYQDRPYMPFRYPNNQTMSLIKLDMNYWSILDKEYFKFMRLKKKIFDEYNIEKLSNNKFFKRLYNNEFDFVFEEFCEFTINHYIHRYPKLFSKKGNLVFNHLLNETYNVKSMDPFLIVTRISMEDFYITYQIDKEIENEEKKGLNNLIKERKCIGVSVAFGGGGFPISTIVGKDMSSIHKPVPYYETNLKKSMNKWFERFIDPVERESIHIVWDLNLSCSEIYSKLKEFENNEIQYKNYIKTIPFEKFEIRIERQTLIKLPKSKAIIFANHPIYLNFINDLKDEPGVPSIIYKMIYESPEGIIKYKHYECIRDHISKGLQDMIEYQIQRGLISKDSPVRTIPTFPFASWMNSNNYSLNKGYVKKQTV